MPGNEVGGGIHNFFGQDNLSHGQRHSHAVDGTWPGLSNSPWVGSPRQIGAHLFSNLKNNNVQQTVDPEIGHGDQASSMQHGLNFSHSNLRPAFSGNESQSQQPTLNGYMHGNQVFQTRLNEAHLLGSESDQCSVTSQLAYGPELKKNSVRMDFPESPVNYDFFGGQPQMISQHSGTLQSLSRQQSGFGEKQDLQQQLMLKQMKELHRWQQLQKQQLQHQETRTLNSVNQANAFAKQVAVNHPSALINGFAVQDASNYSWQHEALASNTNWPQRGSCQAMQGSLNGQMFSPEHGQSPRLIGMASQQVAQSFYGVPVSGSSMTLNQISPSQIDKPIIKQLSGSNSLMDNQLTGVPDQVSVQDGNIVSRDRYQGKNMIGTADGQGLNSEFNVDTLQQVNLQHSDRTMQEFHEGQELAGPSETIQERTVMQVTHSQNVATLDPTEEKILFGSDDNLWDAFGKGTNIGSCGYNIMDGSDILGALPSMHSGSWSALMQSAVAETSSSEVGRQEEWSGLSSHNSEPLAGNQQIVNDSGRQQLAWVDNSLHASRQNFRPFPLIDETNSRMNYSLTGVHQSGGCNLHEQSEQLQNGSPHRFIQQFSTDGAKWLDCSLLQQAVSEGTHAYEKVVQPSGAEPIAKSLSGSLTNQQCVSLCNTRGQPHGRSSGSNFVDSVFPSASSALKNQGNESSLHCSQRADQKSQLLREMSHSTSIWKTDSISNSVADLENAKSTIQCPQVNGEDLNGELLDSSIGRVSQGGSQELPEISNIDIWKNVDFSVNPKGSESPGKNQPYLDERNSNFEPSVSNILGNRAQQVHISGIKENTTESCHNVYRHCSTMGTIENAVLDSNDLCTLPGGKQNSSSHIGRKPSGVRKFQYHPMGDVAVDPSYGAKHVAHSQPMLFHSSQGLTGQYQSYVGQSKFPSHIARNSSEMEKGPAGQMVSKSMFLGSAPGSSAPSDRAVHNYVSNKTMASSQNMFELLHKVDQLREGKGAMQLSSSKHSQSSEMSEAETSDGSVHPQKNRSAASQAFGLQLAPPSQRSPMPHHAISSQDPSHTISSHSSAHITTDKGEKGCIWLASASSVQSKSTTPFGQTSQGKSRDTISIASGQASNNIQENSSPAFSAGFPYSRCYVQNQHVTDAGRQAATSQSTNVSFDTLTSQSKQINESFERAKISKLAMASPPASNAPQNDFTSATEMSQPSAYKLNPVRESTQQSPVVENAPEPEHHGTSAMSQEDSASKMSRTEWTSISTQQHPFCARPFKPPSSVFKQNFQLTNNSETAFSLSQKLEDKNVQTAWSGPSESGAFSMNSQGFVGKEQPEKGDCLLQVSPGDDPAQETMSASQGKEFVGCHDAGTSLLKLASAQNEIEAFGCSLRPNTALNQNYCLLQQMEGVNNTEVDPGHKDLKRFKGPGGAVDTHPISTQAEQQLYGHNSMVRDASTNLYSISPGDGAMLSFSAKPTDNEEPSLPLQDVLSFSQNDSQSSVTQISLQMAPSWFDHGTFKNGQQILALYDIQKAAIMKKNELPLAVGRSDRLHFHSAMEQGNVVPADVGQRGISHKNSSSTSLASENLSTPELLCRDAAMRPKKRRSATSKLVPWHKDMVHGSQRLQNISTAEVYWAQAANRLAEKVEDEAEVVDDGSPVHRSKRRLILTTQLMQMLFQPPLASFFSVDAFSNYESLAYYVVRSTLGDACSSLSCAGSDTPVPSNSGNLRHEKLQSSFSNQYFTDLINKTREVESDLLRLDKRVSILDLRVECQDLEKFSVINRFAKFHGRGGETSSSSDSQANGQKPCPQRYVTALSMPRNLPEGVQCLSL